MKKIQLGNSNTHISEIGFGCSSLLGGTSSDEAIKLLDVAFDSGITHFDVARYYGYGDAEKMLGRFAQGKRSEITITTKFGLTPDPVIAEMGAAIRVVRYLMRRFGWVKSLVKKNVRSVVKKRQFDVVSIKKSFTDSLVALNTDYVDILLLHECLPEDYNDEVIDLMENLKAQGKLMAYGTGSGVNESFELLAKGDRRVPITQFYSNLMNDNRRIFDGFDSQFITHGTFHCYDEVRKLIPAESGDFVSHLLLSYALMANRGGGVLFRTQNPDRLRKNIKMLEETPLSDDEIFRLIQPLRGRQTR